MVKNFKAVMAERAEEYALLTVSPDVTLDSECLDAWVRDMTRNQIKVIEKEGILSFDSKLENPNFRVITSTLDDGTIRFRIYKIEHKMRINKV